MTETTDRSAKSPPHQRSLPPVNTSDFFFALTTAPLVVALLFFWVFLIPVFAVFFGMLPWLFFGGPALWLTIRYFGVSPLLLLSAFLANAAGTPAYIVLTRYFFGWHGDIEYHVRFMTGNGMVFSLAWGMAFWLMYRDMARERTTKQTAEPEDQLGQTPHHP